MSSELYMIDKGSRIGISLGGLLGSGGEANVYVVEKLAQCAAKIYLPEDSGKPDGPRKGASREKLEAMLRRTPPHVEHTVDGITRPQLAWPSHLVEDADGRLQGFLMREAPSIDLETYMSRAASIVLSPNDRSLTRRLLICANLLAAVSEMHAMKHYMVDVKPKNIAMFPDSGMLCLLDNDSFSIDDGNKRHAATALTAGYIAPELLRNTQPPAAVMTDWQDRFALAVLMFQVLNNGIHPFQGAPVEELQSEEWNSDLCAREGWYAYARRPAGKVSVKAAAASVHEAWPAELREMFDRAFTATQGSQRPSAREWRKLLGTYLEAPDAFQACVAYPEDVTHLHFMDMPCHECLFMQAAARADAQRQEALELRAEARRQHLARRRETIRRESESSPSHAGSQGSLGDILPPQQRRPVEDEGASPRSIRPVAPLAPSRVTPVTVARATVSPSPAEAYAGRAAAASAQRAMPDEARATEPVATNRGRNTFVAGAILGALFAIVFVVSGKKTDTRAPAPAPPAAHAPEPTTAAAPAEAAHASYATAATPATFAVAAAPVQAASRKEALSRAMDWAYERNIDDAVIVFAAAKESDKAITDKATQTLMRNVTFMKSFEGYPYLRQQGRKLAARARDVFTTDRAAGLALQLEALQYAYEDREVAADLAYYMALQRHPDAIRAAIYALSMQRPEGRTATSTGWYALAIAMVTERRPQFADGAMLAALAINPLDARGKFCETILKHELAYGRELRPLVERTFKAVKERTLPEQLAPACAQPVWLSS